VGLFFKNILYFSLSEMQKNTPERSIPSIGNSKGHNSKGSGEFSSEGNRFREWKVVCYIVDNSIFLLKKGAFFIFCAPSLLFDHNSPWIFPLFL